MNQVRVHLALRVIGLATAAYGAAIFLAAIAQVGQWLTAAGLFAGGLKTFQSWWEAHRIGTLNAVLSHIIFIVSGLVTLLFGRWLFFSPKALDIAAGRTVASGQERLP